MKILGLIPARYDSSRFPGKPLSIIAGKTMIQRVYEQASKASLLKRVVVATDDARIEAAVLQFGGNVVMTSPEHRSGTDRCFEALCNLGQDFDAVVNIQGDEPFIDPMQIQQIASIITQDKVDIATLAMPITDPEMIHNANVVKVVMNAQGRAMYFSRSAIPYVRDCSIEQWLERCPFYKHVGIYAYKSSVLQHITMLPPGVLEKTESLEQLRWLENGVDVYVGITHCEGISVDTKEDLQKAIIFAMHNQ